MILLASTSDLVRVTTTTAANIDVHVSWVDLASGVVTPGRTNTAIASATTTTIVASPAASTYRTIKTLTLRNKHASLSNTVTLLHSDGSLIPTAISAILAAGEAIHYDEGKGWTLLDGAGRVKVSMTAGGSGAAVAALNVVALTADVTNSHATANTMIDVTGLSFSVVAGEIYWFRFTIPYTAAATSTGSRWSIDGPASPTLLHYNSRWTLTATTETVTNANLYDLPATANATSLLTGNVAFVEGVIMPSINGTVVARFASEVSASPIVAKAGAILHWMRVL